MAISFYKTTFILFLLLVAGPVLAQQGTTAAGAEATGATGTVSCSVGQVVYTYYETGTHNINEGIQQPYEFFTLQTPGETAQAINAVIYPNPATNDVFLSVSEPEKELTCILFDEQGKIISNQNITQNQTTIHIAHLARATYILRVMQKEQEVASFKIIKH